MLRKAILLFVIGAWATPAVAAPILSVQPAATTLSVGDAILFDIVATDVVDLYAYQFDVGFDPGVVHASAVTEGPFLGTVGPTYYIPGVIDNVGGLISFTANTLLGPIPGVTGSGVLAQVGFTGMGPGSSFINLLGVTLLDSTFAGTDTTTVRGSVEVLSAVVPEPATMFCVATGLLWLRRRRAMSGLPRVV
jgi:general secretion pathway protein D